MRTTPDKSGAEPAPSKPANAKHSDIASAPVRDTLAALHVNPDTGLTHAEIDIRRKEHGYNEVAEKKGHPVFTFLGKFRGISAWMLELIMVLSAVLGKYSDLVVVSALLVINAMLSFMQERRAAGVVEALRRRLQVSARVRRDSKWQVIGARELVPGDIVRVRPGDIIPADVKLLTGLMPLPWWQTLAIFAYAMVSCMVVNDAVKVVMIKWLVLNAVVKKPVDVTPQTASGAYGLYERQGGREGRAVQDRLQGERKIRKDESPE